MEAGVGEINDSPIEQVRLTVPITDDISMPTQTFRVWVLGVPACILFAFTSQFFAYRQTSPQIPLAVFQIAVLPVGRMMARVLPTQMLKIPWTPWKFTLNPGPFNVKEHVLVSVLASAGAYGAPFSMEIVSQMKIFYHQEINPLAAFLLLQTTHLLGYGLAGMCIKLLVESPYMWWPNTLATVSFYRALHETEEKQKGELTKLQFFILVSVSSFAYYIVPNYFFPSITSLSFVCWAWKNSVVAQQIGSGRNGLGLGSLGLDWATISYSGNPLVYPTFAMINKMVGFVLIIYVITPIAYWTNLYNARRFPIISSGLFDSKGNKYNISQVLNKDLSFNQQAYDNYSDIHLSTYFALYYGFNFAVFTATLSHTVLFHGRSIWRQINVARKGGKLTDGDVHNRMMKNYKPIPQYWFYIILISMLGLSIFACEGFGKQLQLPFWGILLAVALAMVFMIPIGVIRATTAHGITVTDVATLIIGYLYPGKPIANMAFKYYSTSAMRYAFDLIFDLKQAHYMKIPPRSMFIAQVVGPIISTTVSFGTAWLIFSTVKNICEPAKLPKGSPWTCPGENVVFSTSEIWGVVGPARVFLPMGTYGSMYFFFILGALATASAWWLAHVFPEKKWIRLINVPIILGATSITPPIMPLHIWSWFFVAAFFNFIVYRKYKRWWAKYTYVLSMGLDIGIAFMGLLATLALPKVYGIGWWGLDLDDHCPLAQCPTAPGVVVDGCPVVE